MQLIKDSKSSSGIRSFVCDSNGIVIAETVYRCMICSEIFNKLDDVQRHYRIEHFEDDIDSAHINVDSPEVIDYDNDDFDDEDENVDNSNFIDVPYYEGLDNNCQMSMNCDEESVYQTETLPITANSYANSPLISDFGAGEEEVAVPKTSNLTNGSLKGGYVTCEVCGLTKFYSHISRRYGIFSCESCAKFFYRYCQKPVDYFCPTNGNCPLKIDLPGGRCKACLLNACLKKYIIDPKKHPKIFEMDFSANNHSNQSKISEDIVNNELTNGIDINESADFGDVTPIKGPTKSQLKISSSAKALSTKNSNSLLAKTPADPIIDIKLIKKNKEKPSSSKHLSKSILKFRKKHESSRSRRAACRQCTGCMADDCGSCLYCLDKPKFGGNDIKKQKCLRRRCRLLK